MAKPYKEGAGWSMRQRFQGEDLYVSSCKTAGAAKKKMQCIVAGIESKGAPKGLGPLRTTLAQAMQDYAMERLPFMKGARQEANRINKFLRGAGLHTLVVSAPSADASSGAVVKPGQRYAISLQAPASARKIPRGLSTHRGKLATATASSDAVRDKLSRKTVADVKRFDVQELIDALRREGREPATLQLERALLRGFFNYVDTIWHWSEPKENPATGLKMPAVNNERDRVMSDDEQRRLDESIQTCRNALVGPTLTLLRETAMRSSEPLDYAKWADVDWEAKLIHLKDSKTDARPVPLSPAAIDALRELERLSTGRPEDNIVAISYEALKAAWRRVCERAGVEDLHLHDLRHTAATRMALKTGNVFLVQALTGLRTLSQVARYVNVKASDVVAVMHVEPQPQPPAPAAVVERELEEAPVQEVVVEGNVVRVNFGRR
jgi:integrase